MKSAGVFTDFTNRQKYYRITQCAKDPESAVNVDYIQLVCSRHKHDLDIRPLHQQDRDSGNLKSIKD